MAYRALYRQYRPTRFSQVVGQEHITTTLIHQVESGRIAHAYLFCGTRGTGKTTSARILARAINCLSPENGEPCGQCAACIAAQNELSGDIVEIDAASNNGVDDVRSLIERVQFAPLQLRRRVYIIDEAHMITGPAFNALLKTLEEPPAHVVFILATTEPQKLPATILSRCQRFDFHRLSVADIVSTLKDVLNQAGASIEEDGLLLIARAADGGMRDALSLADQCLAFCGDTVAASDVYNVLGSMEEGFLFNMADALLAGNAQRALELINGVVRGGRNLSVFCSDMVSHFRALLMAKTCGPCADLLDCSADAMDRYLAQAEHAGQTHLLTSLELLLRAQGDMRYLAAPRPMLESVLVRICRPEDGIGLDALEARIEKLELKLAATHVQAVPTAAVSESVAPVPAPQPNKAVDQPHNADAATANSASEYDAPPWEDDYLPAPPPEDGAIPLAKPANDAPQAQPIPTAPAKQAPSGNPVTEPPRPAPKEAVRPAPAPVSAPVTIVSGDAAGLWNAALEVIRGQNIMVHMMAKNGVPQDIVDGTLVVGFSDADEVQFNSVSAAINFNRLLGIVQELSPGTQLRFMKVRLTPTSDEATQRAKELFSDKLTIE